MILKAYSVLGLACFIRIVSGVITTRTYKRIKVAISPPATSSSSKYDSLTKCIAGSVAEGTLANGMQFSSDNDLCNAHVLAVSTLYDAVHGPDDNTETMYVPLDCLPQTCHNGELHFPSSTAIFIPLTNDVPLIQFEGSYYDGGSRTASASILMTKSWSKPFWDGRYPLWHMGTQTDPHRMTLTHRKIFEDVSIFLWVYIDTTETFSKNVPLISAHELPDKNRLFTMVVTTTNTLGLTFSGSNVYSSTTSNEAVIQRKVWQHVGVVFNQQTEKGQMYLNGSPIATGTTRFATPEPFKVDGIEILGRETHTGHIFVCQKCVSIYQEIYDRILTDEEVQEVYLRPFTCSLSICPKPILP